jgi:hypothetical protein
VAIHGKLAGDVPHALPAAAQALRSIDGVLLRIVWDTLAASVEPACPEEPAARLKPRLS